MSVADTYTLLESRRTPRRSRRSSREVAYEAIKQAILSGQIPPHERLVEERLAEALDISRTPVREALAILEHEGLLEAEPYKGLSVRPVTIDEFLNMYEALGVIEAALARSAAKNAAAADIRRMDAALRQAEEAIPGNIPEHLASCRKFQAILGSTAESPFLTRMLLGIEERSDMYLIHSGQPLSPENMHAAVDDRRNILERIHAGDPEGAAELSLAHAERIRLRWRQWYPDKRRD
jgi:DNA-binding GntR family transcriptional regulator